MAARTAANNATIIMICPRDARPLWKNVRIRMATKLNLHALHCPYSDDMVHFAARHERFVLNTDDIRLVPSSPAAARNDCLHWENDESRYSRTRTSVYVTCRGTGTPLLPPPDARALRTRHRLGQIGSRIRELSGSSRRDGPTERTWRMRSTWVYGGASTQVATNWSACGR